MIRFITTVVGSILFFLTQAQQVKVLGFLTDKATGEAIEFATVSALTRDGQTLIGGAISDFEGGFELEIPADGALLKIEFISYRKKEITVSPNAGLDVINIGNLELEADAIAFEALEIIGEKSMSQFSLDKKVYNVGKDMATRGGTAQDILDNVPSITVDVEGNVSMRGSGDVRIFIDGRPSGLVGINGSGGLKSIAANQIERIEVITNPSAKYEAEGMAGIINIVLRKDSKLGFNSSFELSAGLPTEFGAGTNFNYRNGNMNFFVNYGYRNRKTIGSGESFLRLFRDDDVFARYTSRDNTRIGRAHNIRTGVDLYLGRNQTITGSLSYINSNNDNLTSVFYRELLFDFEPGKSDIANLAEYTLRTDSENSYTPRIEYSIDYKKQFSKKGRQLTGLLQFQSNRENENSTFNETNFSGSAPIGLPLNQRSGNIQGERNFQAQLDYSDPVGQNGKFEAGVRISLRDFDNDFKVEDLKENTWIEIPAFSNYFLYGEDVYAAYATYGDKVNKFSYQAGLRYEVSRVVTELIGDDRVNDRNYPGLFPTVHLNYESDQANKFQLSYSRRIRRPRLWDLNPFFTFSDNRNLYAGNPDLDPEFTNSMELGYMRFFENATLTTTVYLRRTNNAITRIRTVEEDGTAITLPQNIGFRENMGWETQFSFSPLKIWKIDTEFNMFRQNFGGEGLPEIFHNARFAWTTRVTNKLTVAKNTDLQIRANYRGTENTPQGVRKAMTVIDIGFNKDLMNNNLSIGINVRDVLNQRRRIYETFGDDFFEEGNFQWQRNSIALNLSYRINAKKERKSQRDRDDFDGGSEF